MTDLAERLRQIERNPSPDLWDEITGRVVQPERPAPQSPARRFALIAASLAIGLAAVAWMVSAFWSDQSPTPLQPVQRDIENGDIWVKVGGGEGGTAIYRVDPQHSQDSGAMWTDQGGTFGGASVAPKLVADDYSFSPDGSQVVFSDTVRPGEIDKTALFVMNADGTDRRQLTSGDVYDGLPAWSPDGDSIAYASYGGQNYIPGCLISSLCPTDLYVIDVDGGAPSRLTADVLSETTPSWSPDGSRLVFVVIDADGVGTLMMVDADSEARSEVPTEELGSISFPSWSPDGTRILFLQFQGGTNHLWTVAPDGSQPRDILDTKTDTNFGRPVWSPEGDRIAYAQMSGLVAGVWTIDPRGEAVSQRVASWPGIDGAPIAWRPRPVQSSGDLTLLLSSSGPSGDQALLTGTLTTDSGCVAVSGGPGSTVYVVWPQGYSLADGGADAWLVDDSGNRLAKIGDQLQMGGGITNLAHAEPQVPGGIPSSCESAGPDAYWFAGTPELVPADLSSSDSGLATGNPCDLLSIEEVETATHSNVLRYDILPNNQPIFPAGKNPCQYVTDDEHTSLTVWVDLDAAADFTEMRDRDPVNTEIVEGLGNDAFTHAGSDVWVRVGSDYFVISSQHGAGRDGALGELLALAHLALG